MAEYAGYVAPKTVDYGAISSGLLSSKLSAEQLRQSEELAKAKLAQQKLEKEQKLEREEDKLLREDLKGITAAEYVPEKSFNTFATEGLGNLKNEIFELNKLKKEGKITNQEYLINYNNLKDQWNQFTSGVKSFKTNLEGLTKSIEKKEQSKIGAGLIGMYANTGQLYNKVLKVKDVNGVRRLQQYTIDKDGNPIEDETITNIGTLAAAPLFSDFNVDYNKKFKEAEEAIGQYKVEQGNTTISDKGAKANFDAQLQVQIEGIIPEDIDKARLLTERMGYDFYFTQQQKEALLDKGVKEDKMVKFALNDKGAYSPFLTEPQKTAAYEYTKANITSRMEYTRTLDEPVKFSVNTGDKKMPQADKDVLDTLESAKNDWNQLSTQGLNSNAAKRIIDMFSTESGPAILKWTPGKKGIDVIRQDPTTPQKIMTIRGEEGMYGLYTPKDKKGNEWTGYDKALKLFKRYGFNNY
jgi:hypothetical protein